MGNDHSKKQNLDSKENVNMTPQFSYMVKLHNKYRNSLRKDGKYNPNNIIKNVNNINNSLHIRAQTYCEFLANSSIFSDFTSPEQIGKHLINAGSLGWNNPLQQKYIDFQKFCKINPNDIGCQSNVLDVGDRNRLCMSFLGSHLPVNISKCTENVNKCISNNSTLIIKDGIPEKSSGGKYYSENEYSTQLTKSLGGAVRGCNPNGINTDRISWPTERDNAIKIYQDSRYCPSAYRNQDGTRVVCPGLQAERNIDSQIYTQGSLYDSQNVGLAYIKDSKGNPIKYSSNPKITSKMISSAMDEIFKKWVSGVCSCNSINTSMSGESNCGNCFGRVQYDKGFNDNELHCNAFIGCSANWANIVWASNQNIGVGNTIVHANDYIYLLCVINYANGSDMNSTSFDQNIPDVCNAQNTKYKVTGKRTKLCD
jgi:hypothetical protein